MPARSRATVPVLLALGAARGQRVRPARTVSSRICFRAWISCPGWCGPRSTPASVSGQPGGKIAPLLEASAVADRCHDCAGDDRTDARNAHEPLAALVPLCYRFDFGRYAGNAVVQSAPVLDQLANEVDHSWRQRIGF